MKKFWLITYILCLTIGLNAQTLVEDSLTTDSATALPWPQNIVERLDHLMEEPILKRTQLGLMVYDLTADSALYCSGERQTMRPASIMKLVTAITALDLLGSGYQFRTSLYYTGTVRNRTLTGDIYCVGNMDPRFNSDDMNAFVESIRRMGVDTIRGRLIEDTSMKDESRLGEGWCWDDDNPTLTPLMISKKDNFMLRFVEELRDKGIYLDAPCSTGIVPNGAAIICSRFHPFEQILLQMLKDSDNLYAESMLYQIAMRGGVKHATAKDAHQHIRKLITKIGLTPGNYKLADGSGLSLYNYVSPELMVRLLRYAYKSPQIFSSLYPSLPIAGEDGTLSKRMKGFYTKGNVHAKTGTLTGISSLAGYCTAANNHLLAFCIINQGVLQNSKGRDYQDKVCTALCEP